MIKPFVSALMALFQVDRLAGNDVHAKRRFSSRYFADTPVSELNECSLRIRFLNFGQFTIVKAFAIETNSSALNDSRS